MTLCNLMTGAGFDTRFLGEYGMAWLVVAILFFIIIFSRRWLGEEFGMPFSIVGAFVGAYVPYLIVITITCSVKFSLAAGMIGFVIGAFLAGMFFGEG